MPQECVSRRECKDYQLERIRGFDFASTEEVSLRGGVDGHAVRTKPGCFGTAHVVSFHTRHSGEIVKADEVLKVGAGIESGPRKEIEIPQRGA